MSSAIDPHNWKKKYPNKLDRNNYLRTVEFRHPDWIPCSISIFPAIWARHREKLRDLLAQYPFIFGPFVGLRREFDNIPREHRPNTYYVDNWKCGWYVSQGGYEGQVQNHPLADWDQFSNYQFPDPLKYTERGQQHWAGLKWAFRIARKKGILTAGGGERLFDRFYFLRGFEPLMKDFATNNSNLPHLIQKLQDHEIILTNKWLSMGVDQMFYHTDIGTQDRLMISPRQFRQYIKPMFKAIFQIVRKSGAHVYLSSDGYLLDIVDDLLECGVSIHDPQERANSIEGIAKHYKGKLCIDLDLDRQSFPFLSPEGIKRQIKKAVETLSSSEGGLMMKAEIADPNIPLENIKAICDSFQEYSILK